MHGLIHLCPPAAPGLPERVSMPGTKRSICMLSCMILPLPRTTTGQRTPSDRSWSGAKTGCSATPRRAPKPARSSTPLPPPPVPMGSLWRAISPGFLPRRPSSFLGTPTNKNEMTAQQFTASSRLRAASFFGGTWEDWAVTLRRLGGYGYIKTAYGSELCSVGLFWYLPRYK